MDFSEFKGLRQDTAKHLVNQGEENKNASALRDCRNINIDTKGIRKRGGFEATECVWSQYLSADCLGQLRPGNGKRWNFATGKILFDDGDDSDGFYFVPVNDSPPAPPAPPSTWRFKHIVEAIDERLDYYDETASGLPKTNDASITGQNIIDARAAIISLATGTWVRDFFGYSYPSPYDYRKFSKNHDSFSNSVNASTQRLALVFTDKADFLTYCGKENDWTSLSDQAAIFTEMEDVLKFLNTLVLDVDYTQGGNTRAFWGNRSGAYLSGFEYQKRSYVSALDAWSNLSLYSSYGSQGILAGRLVLTANPPPTGDCWDADAVGPLDEVFPVCDSISLNEKYSRSLQFYIRPYSNSSIVVSDISNEGYLFEQWRELSSKITGITDTTYILDFSVIKNRNPLTWTQPEVSLSSSPVSYGWQLIGSGLCEIEITFPSDANLGKVTP
ncbi:MAG: hypothetical protein A2017_06595 [Lentisphaerae bacterium GWF2_44_16]|nr:MAG: hypothetical protein A2017_06595 [Lentisphaerae bacterium GWF2_44_16]